MSPQMVTIEDVTAGTQREVEASTVPALPEAPADDPVTKIVVHTTGRTREVAYFTLTGVLLRRDVATLRGR